MSTTPNLGLELIPANSLQPWVAANDALQVLDALVQTGIEGALSDPPATSADDVGLMWRVGENATGDWAGHEDDIALCSAPNLWRFLAAGLSAKFYLDKSNGGFYKYDQGWVLAAGLSDAPSDGNSYGRKDGSWVTVGGGGGSGIPDAPADGKLYGRQDEEWTEVPESSGIPDAPADGKLYGRQNATWVEVPDEDGGQDTGYSNINVQTGASYTLVLADAGSLVTMDNAASNTLTVPPNSSVAFPVGTRVDIGQDGIGQTTVTAGTGVTIRSRKSLKMDGQLAKASLIKRDVNTWDLVGELEATP